MSEDYGSVDESEKEESVDEGPEAIEEIDPKPLEASSDDDDGEGDEGDGDGDGDEGGEEEPPKAKKKKEKPEWEKVTDEDVSRYLSLRVHEDETSTQVRLTNADFNKIRKYKKERGAVPLPPRGPRASKAPKSKYAPRNIKSILKDARDYADLEAEMRTEGKLFELGEVNDEQLIREMNEENAQLVKERIVETKRFKRAHKNGSRFVTTLDRSGAEFYADVWVTTEKTPDDASNKVKSIAKSAGFKYVEASTVKQQVKTKLRHLAVATEYQMWEMGGIFYSENQERLDELQVLLDAAESALRLRKKHVNEMEAVVDEWRAIIEDEDEPRSRKESARKNLAIYEKIVSTSIARIREAASSDDRAVADRAARRLELYEGLEAPDFLDLDVEEEAIVAKIEQIKEERDRIGNQVKRVAPSQAPVRLTSKNEALLKRRDRLEDLEAELSRLETKLAATLVKPHPGLSEFLKGGDDLFADAEVIPDKIFDAETVELQARIAAIRGEMGRIAADAEGRQRPKDVEISEFATPEALIKTVVLSCAVEQAPWVLSIDGNFFVARDYRVEGDTAIVKTKDWTRPYPASKVGVLFSGKFKPNRHRPDLPEGKIVLVKVRGIPCAAVITETFRESAVVRILQSETSKILARHKKIIEGLDLGPEIAKIALERQEAVNSSKFPKRAKVPYSECRGVIYESIRITSKTPLRVFTPSLRSTVEKMYFDTLRTVIPTPKGAAETPKPSKVSFDTYALRRATAEAKATASKNAHTSKSFQEEAERLKALESDGPGLIRTIINDFGSFGPFSGVYANRAAFDQEFSRDVVYKLAAQVISKPIAAVTRRFIAALASSPSGIGAAGIMAAAVNAHLKIAAETPLEAYQTRLAKTYIDALIAKKAESLVKKYLVGRDATYRKNYEKLYDDQGYPRLGLGVTPTTIVGGAGMDFGLTDEELILKIKDLVANYNPPAGALASEYLVSGVLFPLVVLRGTLAESVAYARTKIACGDYAVEHLHRAEIYNLIPEAVMAGPVKVLHRTLKSIEEYFATIAMALSEGLPPERDLFDPSAATSIAYGKFKPVNYPDVRQLVKLLMNPVEACRLSTNTGLSFRGDQDPQAKDAKQNVTADLIICFNRGKFVCKDKRELASLYHTDTLDEPLDERTKKVVLAAYPTLDSVPTRFIPVREVSEPEVSLNVEEEAPLAPPKDPYSSVSVVCILDSEGEPMLASFQDETVRVIHHGLVPSTRPTLLVTTNGEIPEGAAGIVVVVGSTKTKKKALEQRLGVAKGRASRNPSISLVSEVVVSEPALEERLGAIFRQSVSVKPLASGIADYVPRVTSSLVHEAVTKPKVESMWWDLEVSRILAGSEPEEELAGDEELSKLLSSPEGEIFVKGRLISAFLGKKVPEATRSSMVQDLNAASGAQREDVEELGKLAIDKNIAQYAERLIATFAKVAPSERRGWLLKVQTMTPIAILGLCEEVLGPSGASKPVDVQPPKVYTVTSASDVFVRVYKAQDKSVKISASIALGVFPPQNSVEEKNVFQAFRDRLNARPGEIVRVVQSLPGNFLAGLKLLD